MLPVLYSITLFLSAALIFWAEPMIAKQLLPALGGTPAVWNTCMVFFQTALLAGYALAHAATSRMSDRAQRWLVVVVLAAAAVTLPIRLDASRLETIPATGSPTGWLLVTLVLMAGLPFLALSTLAPALQRWFSRTAHPRRNDPYFLYAASNAGSLVSLLAYPALIEPRLRLAEQTRLWGFGFIALAALVAGCAALTRFHLPQTSPAGATATEAPQQRVRWRDRLLWLALAAIPSSLLLGTTTFITTDIASIPLLWIVPLALYLLTFIIAFAGRLSAIGNAASIALPYGAVALGFALLISATSPVWLVLALHLTVMFLAAMACHHRLASTRPGAAHLTEFYLWLAAGGALGGFFNALVAPVLFNHIHEYPLALALAAGFGAKRFATDATRSAQTSARRQRILLWGLAAIAVVLIALAPAITRALGQPGDRTMRAVAIGIPLLLVASFLRRPAWFGSLLGAVLVLGVIVGPDPAQLRVKTLRSFFGVTQVTRDTQGKFHELMHGHTVHGRQYLDAQRRCEPLAYYHRTGPFGDVYRALRGETPLRVGVIGLGSGAMVAHALPGDAWTYFEIDPVAIAVATDTNLFRFLSDCAPARVDIVPGDARLQLRGVPGATFDLLALDAFSSDAIPTHLLTREALALYLSKLKPGGLIAMHVSNRYLDLEPVVAALAADAGLVVRKCDDSDTDTEGKEISEWTVFARSEEELGQPLRRARWTIPTRKRGVDVWTDDRSSILTVFSWE